MDRAAVFVNSGYFFAEGSRLLFGDEVKRADLEIDLPRFEKAISDCVKSVCGLPLLRIYWYDASFGLPFPDQEAIGRHKNIKLQLGRISESGQQKGVDTLIVSDMATLARNRAMADALLLSGDEDLLIGVRHAQEMGVRLHLLGIAPKAANQSRLLMAEADTSNEWNEETLRWLLKKKAAATPAQPTAAPARKAGEAGPLVAVAEEAIAGLDPETVEYLIKNEGGRSYIPPELDMQLLRQATTRLGRYLDDAEKVELRGAFHRALRRPVKIG